MPLTHMSSANAELRQRTKQRRLPKPAPKPQPDPDRSAILTALFNQKTEWTKSLFSLSAAGLALCVSTVVAKAQDLPVGSSLFLLAASLAFLLCAWSCISAFDKSGQLLEVLLATPTAEPLPRDGVAVANNLATLKTRQLRGFDAGLVLLMCCAAYTSIHFIHK
jgi:hypothetical protein